MSNNPMGWKGQLMNDLKNQYAEGLELIGAVNDPDQFSCREVGKTLSTGMKIIARNSELRGGSFFLLFYQQPKYNKDQEFRFFVEFVYDDIGQKELQELLNKKIIDDNAIYRTCLTVYEKQNVMTIKSSHDSRYSVSSDGGFGDQDVGIYCHILVFEKRNPSEEVEEQVYMVQKGKEGEVSLDLHADMNQFIYETEVCQKFRIAGFLPKQKVEDSLYIFAAK